MVLDCAFSPAGDLLVAAFGDGTLRFWEVATGADAGRIAAHGDRIGTCAFSPCGESLLSGADDGSLVLWNVADRSKIRSFPGHQREVHDCAFSPDGSWFVSACRDGTLKQWDTGTGRLIRTLSARSEDLRGCVVSPDGGRVVTTSYDGILAIWDARKGRLEREIDADPGGLARCAISPDGRWVATAGSELQLWDLATGEPDAVFPGLERAPLDCCFSPDGSCLASSDYDKTVTVWDVKTQQKLAVWRKQRCYVLGCAFSPDGKLVAAAAGVDWMIHRKPRFEGEVWLHRFERPPEPVLPELYRRLAQLEEAEPEAALAELAERECDNTAPQRGLMAAAVACPIVAFAVAWWVHDQYHWHPALVTILIWCYLGFAPFAWAYGKRRLEISGASLQVGGFMRWVLAPLIGFFYNTLVVATVAIVGALLALAVQLTLAAVVSVTSGASFGQAFGDLLNRFGVPFGVAGFVVVFLVLGSDTPRLLSPKRVLLGLRLNARELAKLSVWLIVTVVLAGGVFDLWYESPSRGLALSLLAALLGALGLARTERDFELSLLYRLTRVRLLRRLDRDLEAEWHLYQLSHDFQKPSFPDAVETLIGGLAMLLAGDQPSRIQQRLVEIDPRKTDARLRAIYYDQVRQTLRLARARS